MKTPPKKGKRGFASMDKDLQRKIASKGGKTAHAVGHAHKFTPEEARLAGKRGGTKTSSNRKFMSKIGTKGGYAAGNKQ